MISSSTLQGHCHPWSSLQRPQKSCLKSDHFNTEQNKNQSMGWPRRWGCCSAGLSPPEGRDRPRRAARAQLPFHQADIFIPIKKCEAAATVNQTGANPEKWTFHSCPAPEMRKGGKETRPFFAGCTVGVIRSTPARTGSQPAGEEPREPPTEHVASLLLSGPQFPPLQNETRFSFPFSWEAARPRARPWSHLQPDWDTPGWLGHRGAGVTQS